MSNEKKVLIVDSNIELIRSVDEFLSKNGFLVFSAFSKDEAVKKSKEAEIDVIIVNSFSFGTDTTAVSLAIKEDEKTESVPVIVLFDPGNEEVKRELKGKNIDCLLGTRGAGDELLAAVRSLSKIRYLSIQVEHIENSFHGLVKVIDARDAYTKGHSDRVTKVSRIIAEKLSLPKERIRILDKAAKLHDIGKIGIPESILNKPGVLTEEEYNYIKQHPVISEKICSSLIPLRRTLPIIRYHHERYDGKGYPDGIKGEEIPLEARIIAVADCFDAMATKRPYRDKLPKERIISIFNAGAGTQWDKKIVDVFIGLLVDHTIENTNLYSFD